MADRVMRGRRSIVAAKKKATPARRRKKSKLLSAMVLVLHGSSALRRRKSAERLAESLRVELFRVDVSAIIGRYIGETEKNLDSVFDKAETSGSILFFDEADALFGDRNIVKDAHDRFANAETAHFLQRIERHHGIVILTTNGKRRIEQAFLPQKQVVVMVGVAGTERKRT
ncbi:MAG: ATP-binding protein [Nitrospira sp.]|nr:ATP-binding protein [Nitrospira sp.]